VQRPGETQPARALTSVTSVFVQRPWRVPDASLILLKIMGPWGLFRGLDSGVRNSMACLPSWRGPADEPYCKQSLRRVLKRDFVTHIAQDAAGCGNILSKFRFTRGCHFACGMTEDNASPASRQVDSSRIVFRGMLNKPDFMFTHYTVPLHQIV
jgi:hypothetical protein